MSKIDINISYKPQSLSFKLAPTTPKGAKFIKANCNGLETYNFPVSASFEFGNWLNLLDKGEEQGVIFNMEGPMEESIDKWRIKNGLQPLGGAKQRKESVT